MPIYPLWASLLLYRDLFEGKVHVNALHLPDVLEYEVGDWVFVLIPNSTCSECGRKEACREGCEGGLGDKFIILPLKVGNYGP